MATQPFPPLPPGARLNNEPAARPAPRPARGRPAAIAGTVTEPVDGDTVRMSVGPNLRLLGIDAPERRQQGWQRDGSPVPIGELSTTRLGEIIARNTPQVGPEAMRSYGRPVAPVMADGLDVGQRMLRGGDAWAAPEYIEDEDRRFQYMQAQRLARQNMLGVHDVATQTPAEFREDPEYVVPRGRKAVAWDTPTPFNGLPAEVEQELARLVYDNSVSPEEVSAWVRGHGAIVTADNIRVVREHHEKHGTIAPMQYQPAARILTDTGTGAEGAAIRGTASGFLMGALDELGAVPDALGGTADRENIWNSDRRFADIVQNNQRQNAYSPQAVRAKRTARFSSARANSRR